MSSHLQGSGPRSNAYSESKFTNWTEFDPFFGEARAAYKRFDERLPAAPKFPKIIALPPLKPDFVHPCTREQIESRLKRLPGEQIAGLRAVFLLSGTRKQEALWMGSVAACYYGMYWRACVFLCAFPWGNHYYTDDLRQFYLEDVLIHEVAHHTDRFRQVATHTKEAFACGFAERSIAATRRQLRRK